MRHRIDTRWDRRIVRIGMAALVVSFLSVSPQAVKAQYGPGYAGQSRAAYRPAYTNYAQQPTCSNCTNPSYAAYAQPSYANFAQQPATAYYAQPTTTYAQPATYARPAMTYYGQPAPMYYGQPAPTYYSQAAPTYYNPPAPSYGPPPTTSDVQRASYTPSAAQPTNAGQAAPTQAPAASGDAYGFTNWLNATRASYGLPAVGYDANLENWAAMNNGQQAARGLGHYVMGPARRQNSAMGNAANIGAMWMNSPAHRAALLDPSIRAIGLAGNGMYWTFNAY